MANSVDVGATIHQQGRDLLVAVARCLVKRGVAVLRVRDSNKGASCMGNRPLHAPSDLTSSTAFTASGLPSNNVLRVTIKPFLARSSAFAAASAGVPGSMASIHREGFQILDATCCLHFLLTELISPATLTLGEIQRQALFCDTWRMCVGVERGECEAQGRSGKQRTGNREPQR